MKRNKKLALAVVIAMLMLSVCLAGCGGQAKTTGIFLSPSKMSYSNMRPTYNYYLTTFAHEEITLYEDGTYCLIISSSQFSALELSESTNDAKGNERANSIYKYYGKYTSAPNELDEDLLDVKLEKPTHIVLSNDQRYYLDTDNWTTDMGKRVIPPTGYDPSTGAPIVDENAKPLTATEYLATAAFEPITVQVNVNTASFDFTEFFPKEG